MSRYADVERMPSGPNWDALDDKEKAVVLSFLIKLPTADVEEVRHGEWLPLIQRKHFADTETVSTNIVGFYCSLCGSEGKFKYRYCHCGAKMDAKGSKE